MIVYAMFQNATVTGAYSLRVVRSITHSKTDIRNAICLKSTVSTTLVDFKAPNISHHQTICPQRLERAPEGKE